MRNIVFELCAETLEACMAAREGGATRIELCCGLSEGGLTPSHGFLREAIRLSGIPVHALIRPRAGNFLYSAAEFRVMEEDIEHARALGAAGVVLGLLAEDGRVDVERTCLLVEKARPMEVTFHRAIDSTPVLSEALEAVILAGCDRVLTSGGQRDVMSGASELASLVEQARGRIVIAAGGGLRPESAAHLARLTGAEHYHGSLRRRVASAARSYVVEAAAVSAVVESLRTA